MENKDLLLKALLLFISVKELSVQTYSFDVLRFTYRIARVLHAYLGAGSVLRNSTWDWEREKFKL